MSHLYSRNQWQHPVMIPPARRLSPQQLAAHRRLRLARAPKLPAGFHPPSATPLPLCKVGAMAWLLGAALALLCSLDGWL